MLSVAVALGFAAALVGAAYLARYCAGVLKEAQDSRVTLESNMERLAVRAHAAALADRDRAKRISDAALAMQDVSHSSANLVRLPIRKGR